MQLKSITMLLLGLALTSFTSAAPAGQGTPNKPKSTGSLARTPTSGGAGGGSSGQGASSSTGAGSGGYGETRDPNNLFPPGWKGIPKPKPDEVNTHPALRGASAPQYATDASNAVSGGRAPGGVGGSAQWTQNQGSSQGGRK